MHQFLARSLGETKKPFFCGVWTEMNKKMIIVLMFMCMEQDYDLCGWPSQGVKCCNLETMTRSLINVCRWSRGVSGLLIFFSLVFGSTIVGVKYKQTVYWWRHVWPIGAFMDGESFKSADREWKWKFWSFFYIFYYRLILTFYFI